MPLIKWQTELTRKGGKVVISGLPIAMHCHHYNINLQAMLESSLAQEGIELMYRSAEEATYFMFKEYFRRYTKIRTVKSRIELGCTIYQNCGMGVLHFITLNEEGGAALSPSSHHVTGWLAKHGKRDTPGCHFARGWIAGFCEILFGRPLGHYKVIERSCKMMRNEYCVFEIQR